MAIILTAGSLFAQGGQRQTPEERTKATIGKLAPLQLTTDQQARAATVFNDFYSAQQKAMEEMRSSGTMDRTAIQAKRKELADARDAKLKEIFTPEQLKKWFDEIEPTLRPQRNGGERAAGN